MHCCKPQVWSILSLYLIPMYWPPPEYACLTRHTSQLMDVAHGSLLCGMQARDDAFVSFSDGKKMFNELLYLAEGATDIPFDCCDSDSDSSDSGAIQAVYGAMKRALNSYTNMLSSTNPPSKLQKLSKGFSKTHELAVTDGAQRTSTLEQKLKQHAKAIASDVRSAEFVEILGGHCTGFLWCNSVLPDAIIKSLDRLRKKTASAA
jgi:hypothetical protein